MTREQLIRLTRKLQSTTGIQLKPDACCYAFGYPMFDYMDFDNKLQRMYPDEYKEDMSLCEFLTYKFGKDTANLVENILKQSMSQFA